MVKKVRHAIILAGGKGERLRPYTSDRPKPMVEVAGKPILAYQLEQLRKAEVEEVVFALSYCKEALQKHVGTGKKYGMKVWYSVEESPLGRGGAIKKAISELKGGDWEDVLILNGDNLWKMDLVSMIKKHQGNGTLVTIAVVPLKSPYGVVEFNGKDQVLGFKEKPILPHWINAGVYIFSKNVEPLLPKIGDHETETFPKLPKEKFLVFESEDYWRAIDTVKDLMEAEKESKEIFASLV